MKPFRRSFEKPEEFLSIDTVNCYGLRHGVPKELQFSQGKMFESLNECNFGRKASIGFEQRASIPRMQAEARSAIPKLWDVVIGNDGQMNHADDKEYWSHCMTLNAAEFAWSNFGNFC